MAEAESREFGIDIVLSIVTGRSLVEDSQKIHEALQWLAGEPIWTHQIPRVLGEAREAIIAWYPQFEFADIIAENKTADFKTPVDGVPAWRHWLGKWQGQLGKAILILHRLDEAQHERIDPKSELAEKIHPSRIITI